MTLGEERFAGWVDEEPSQALCFLGLAGSSVLLMSPLHPDIRRLRDNPEYHRYRDDWAAAGYAPVVGSGATADDPNGEASEDGIDTGVLDLDTLSLDFGSLGSFGDASSAMNSSLDSGGGGSWGDGGWGGGGSWGGDGGGGGWGGDGGGGFGGGDGGGGGGGS